MIGIRVVGGEVVERARRVVRVKRIERNIVWWKFGVVSRIKQIKRRK